MVRQALSRSRAALRALCAEAGYFADTDASRADHMMEVERMCTVLDATRLDTLHRELASGGDPSQRFQQEVERVQEQLQQER